MVGQPIGCLVDVFWSCSDRHGRVVVASVLLVNAHTWGLNSVRFLVGPLVQFEALTRYLVLCHLPRVLSTNVSITLATQRRIFV